uniref:Uncharacterized protein n=1 Tax=Tanacetum cinerariifolium TaxID=118510 RepID=A0A699GSM7_TANCI|nr:hypothetical protein [Tanacetum cinerariifolium]
MEGVESGFYAEAAFAAVASSGVAKERWWMVVVRVVGGKGTYVSWKAHTYHGRNMRIMEGTYISWKERTYHGRNIHVMEGNEDKKS